MAVRCVHEEPVNATCAEVFAFVDDLPGTAAWLPPCISLANLDGPPNAVGHRLEYVYRNGSRPGRMAGMIVHRVPGERLCCRYEDSLFEVVVDLRMQASGGKCLSIHDIEIIPKSFMMKLMQPVIRLGLRRQTLTAAANLRMQVEARHA